MSQREHGMQFRRRGFESRQLSAGRVSLGKPILSSVTEQEHPKEKSQTCGALDLEGTREISRSIPSFSNERATSRGSKGIAQGDTGVGRARKPGQSLCVSSR